MIESSSGGALSFREDERTDHTVGVFRLKVHSTVECGLRGVPGAPRFAYCSQPSTFESARGGRHAGFRRKRGGGSLKTLHTFKKFLFSPLRTAITHDVITRSSHPAFFFVVLLRKPIVLGS